MAPLIHNRKAIEVFRRELRKNPTYVESLLWDQLRGSQLDGRKFRRQHSVGVYILDFHCPTKRLCVEIDGSVHSHSDAILHDKDRDAALAQLQIRTLRINNAEVETDIETVLTKIRTCFNN